MGYRIKVTEHAHNDLDQIVSYIVEELGNPPAALSLLATVENVYEKLAETPNMWSGSSGYRPTMPLRPVRRIWQ